MTLRRAGLQAQVQGEDIKRRHIDTIWTSLPSVGPRLESSSRPKAHSTHHQRSLPVFTTYDSL